MIALVALLILGCVPEGVQVELAPTSVETEAGAYSLELIWEPNPHVAMEPVSLGVVAQEGGALSTLQIEPWMPDHNHGLTGDLEIHEDSDGIWLGEWTYPMEGYWELTVSVDGEQGIDTVDIAVELNVD